MSSVTTDHGARLDELLGLAIAGFDIPDAVYVRAVARYEDVGRWLDQYWSGSTAGGLVYPQGSLPLGTVVQRVDRRTDYDIDLVCRRDLTKESTTQSALKADVGEGLQQYVRTDTTGRLKCHEGKRCWTLENPEEPFHMDVLPAIPNTELGGNGIWLTDKTLRLWQPSDPLDYAAWFRDRMRDEFIQLREQQARTEGMDVANVPDWRIKTTLQRTVQALKRHRDLYFKNPEDRPASIIITTLAACAYVGGGSLYEVLVDVTAKMPRLVDIRDGIYWVPNPVYPAENFADRWRRHPGRARLFFDWMEKAATDFSGYSAERGVDRVLHKFAESFGELPARRAGQGLGTSLLHARDAGVLGVGSAGLLGPATQRAVPRHTFHGDLPRPGSA